MPQIYLDDTIAAIATPLGEGGISVIRLSGPACFFILSKCFQPKNGKISEFASHTIHLGQIIHPDGRVMEQALISVFREPHSYTGQDVIEISSHGGLVVTKSILNLLIQHGARHAEPGEFTKRAFLNGKIDLTQAEAVLDLIRAKSEKSLALAVRQLSGYLSQKFKWIKEELMKIYAHMEAFLDFPEEHLEVYEDKTFLEKFQKIRVEIKSLIEGFQRGALLREGVTVVIAGRPNVGKSSLFNALLSRDRAIVSEYPGTTRDTLEEAIEVGGIYMKLVDTAGLSPELEKSHPLDKMSIEKTRQILQKADCFLYVLDSSSPLQSEDREAYREIQKIKSEQHLPKATFILMNKMDLPARITTKMLEEFVSEYPPIAISTKTKQGLDQLEKFLADYFKNIEQESEQITRLRHKNALEEALTAFDRAENAFCAQASLELVVEDLRRAIDSLRELVGEIYSEDLLDIIFSEFCIGK